MKRKQPKLGQTWFESWFYVFLVGGSWKCSLISSVLGFLILKMGIIIATQSCREIQRIRGTCKILDPLRHAVSGAFVPAPL